MRMGTCLGSGSGADPGAQIRIRARVKDSRMEEDRLSSPDRVRIRTAGGRRQARLRIQPAWADPFLLLFLFAFASRTSYRAVVEGTPGRVMDGWVRERCRCRYKAEDEVK